MSGFTPKFRRPAAFSSADVNEGDHRGTSTSGEQGGFLAVPPLPLRAALPIQKHREKILYALEHYPVLILVGETGSGKSTQLPQMLDQAGWTQHNQCVVCTEPRRLSAITLGRRVSEEMNVNLGEEVGYAVRFDEQCDKNGVKTAIKFATNLLLIRETFYDPLLSRYSVVIVDEAHERTLQSDVLLGLLKKILRQRLSDFRVIITSATADTDVMRDFFETATSSEEVGCRKSDQVCLLHVSGDLDYPVDIAYLQRPCRNYLFETISTVLSIHSRESPGDILCFLPSEDDVKYAVVLLEQKLEQDSSYGGASLRLFSLYDGMPLTQQMEIFEGGGNNLLTTESSGGRPRRCIFATSIAETGITVSSVKFVVDSGFTQYSYFDVRSGVEKWITCLASRAVAIQRAGRAGRTGPGRVFRLMTETTYTSSDVPVHAPPEMQRGDVTWAVLQLKAIGIDDILHFDFISPPSPVSLIYALELLYSLGALDEDCALTATGSRMAELPLNPRMSKCLLTSLQRGCAVEMLNIAAMCSVGDPFISIRSAIRASFQADYGASTGSAGPTKVERRRRLQQCIDSFTSPLGDHITLLNVYNGYIESGNSRQWCEEKCLQHRVLHQAFLMRTNMLRLLKQYEGLPPSEDRKPVRFSFSTTSSSAIISDGGRVDQVEEEEESLDYLISSSSDMDKVRRCLVAGYFANAAKLGSDGCYHTLRGFVPASLHESCRLRGARSALPEWIVYNEVVEGRSTSSSNSSGSGSGSGSGNRGAIVLREVTRVHPRWLVTEGSHFYSLQENETAK